MKRKSVLTAAVLSFLIIQACQNPSNKGTEMDSAATDTATSEIVTDTTGINRGAGMMKFMTEASIGGMMEIELGKLAEQKATNPKIQEFAKTMVADHTKIAESLQQLAQEKRITLPTALPQTDQQHMVELQNMPVTEFEAHYMEMMVKDHLKTLDLFKSATTSGDTPLQTFATGALRKLEAHYKAAIAIKDKSHE